MVSEHVADSEFSFEVRIYLFPFAEVYMGDELDWLEAKLATIKRLQSQETFQKRPFVEPRKMRTDL